MGRVQVCFDIPSRVRCEERVGFRCASTYLQVAVTYAFRVAVFDAIHELTEIKTRLLLYGSGGGGGGGSGDGGATAAA